MLLASATGTEELGHPKPDAKSGGSSLDDLWIGSTLPEWPGSGGSGAGLEHA